MKTTTKLLNLYSCTLYSDKGHKSICVAASSFGEAASTCYRSILSWDDHDAYELSKIVLMDSVFVKKFI